MRRVVVIVLAAAVLFLALSGGASADQAGQEPGWQTRLTLPSGEIYDAVFASPDVVWATGFGGIFRSADGGRGWSLAETAEDFGGYSSLAAAPDGMHGWAVGPNGVVFGTADGGMTWRRQTSGTQVNLLAVASLGGDRAIAAGFRAGFSDVVMLDPSPRVILRTDDAGASWRELRIAGDYAIGAISALADGARIWMAGQRCASVTNPHGGVGCQALEYALLRSDDGGASWQTTPVPSLIDRLAFTGANTGWAAATSCSSGNPCDEQVLRTTDGGSTWKTVRTTRDGAVALQALGASDLLVSDEVCGNSCASRLFETSDGGETWRQIGASDGVLRTVAFAGRQRGVWLGTATPQWTADGTTWGLANFPMTVGSGAFDFVDASRGWLAASRLLRSEDAGLTWTPISDFVPVSLDFISASEGWAVTRACQPDCSNITVLHSTDGGVTWSRQFDTQLGDVPTVHFVDSRNGWLASPAAPDNALFRTSDGGATWRQQRPPEPDAQLAFVDARTLWAFAAACPPGASTCPARTYRSADGGDTWLRLADIPPSDSCIRSNPVAAIDALRAWVSRNCSGAATVWRTSDGGRTWRAGRIPGAALFGLRFFDGQTGRAGGYQCSASQCTPTIWRSADGGATWLAQPAGAASEGYPPDVSILFVAPERAFALVGTGGGLFAVVQQRLLAFVGVGGVAVAPPAPRRTLPDTGSGSAGGSGLGRLPLAVAAGAATLGLLACGVGARRRRGRRRAVAGRE
ncbi:MAG: hypothetical protein IVW36_05520 [Dehalococcoidia bacterium]|nr:hypothetical protein [Dehalococcoidia bacterium]